MLPGSKGHLVALLSKIWLLVVPIIWLLFVEKENLKVQYPKGRDLLAGVGLGLLMLCIILIVYWFGSLLRLACDNIMLIGRVPSRGDLVMVLLNLLLNLAWIHQPYFCRYSNFPDWLATYLFLTKM
ncbi:hypothetical protein [Nostoc sp.]|uniref:hypothetical protein n=1 Tax=Nostoc sp. TaxID=1180 RepID=UPI002FFA91C5